MVLAVSGKPIGGREAMSEPSILVVLPARAGSKGFPGKNRILWDYAQPPTDRGWTIVLTTDDSELAIRGALLGYTVWERPDHLASDTASMADVVADVCRQMPPHDAVLIWQLTQPCRRLATVDKAIQQWVEQGRHGTVVTLQPVPDHYAPERMVTIGGDGHAWGYSSDVLTSISHRRRQDVERAYVRDGQAYVLDWERAIKGDWYDYTCTAVIEDQPVPLPIDSEQDWLIAKAWLEAHQAEAYTIPGVR